MKPPLTVGILPRRRFLACDEVSRVRGGGSRPFGAEALATPRQIGDEAQSDAAPGKDVAGPEGDASRIVVSPDQIFPKQLYQYTRIPFERVVVRYILFSGAVVAVLTALGAVSLALFKW